MVVWPITLFCSKKPERLLLPPSNLGAMVTPKQVQICPNNIFAGANDQTLQKKASEVLYTGGARKLNPMFRNASQLLVQILASSSHLTCKTM